MASEGLQKARKYEIEQEKQIKEQDRPSFHLASRVGWMNDPNGFSIYQGKYHMFYQYHPYTTQWGPMHWGHAVSEDLLHWEYLPAAIAPDETYDKDGCFSGSTIELKDGRQLLLYTGVRREEQEDLPEGGSRFDFRDPKLWQEKDGSYACVVGNCDDKKDGRILLYESMDGWNWKNGKILIQNKERVGRMWECPDFFSLDRKQVLLTSPQEIMPKGLERHNGNGTICVIGRGEREFQEETIQTIDYGIDFYAPQTVLTGDGRRVMIGWMQNWDTCGPYREEKKWFGQMSLPRELQIRDGRLIQSPIRELETLRTEKKVYEKVAVNGKVELAGISGRRIDLELNLRPAQQEALYQSFSLQFAADGTYYTSIRFAPHESVVELDRTFSGTRSATVHQRRCLVKKNDGRLKLRLILDRFSAELFINDGEQTMSATIYTPQEADKIAFVADGDVVMDVVKYGLEG